MGVDIDWQSRRPKISTALREAAGHGHVAIVELLLAAGAQVDDAASLAKLGYRELQAECKRRGLLAIGRREELIGRLTPEAPA